MYLLARLLVFFALSILSVAQAFEIPRTATVIELETPSELSDEETPKNEEGQFVLFRYPQVLARYDWIRVALRTKFGEPKHVKTVFYPMSSYDVSLPAILFPEASLYIFLDDHPAFDLNAQPDKVQPSFRSKLDEGLLLGGGAASGYIGESLIGEVLRLMPGAKIIRTQAFFLRDEKIYSFELRKELPAVHLELKVEYAGSTKTLLYLNGYLGRSPLDKENKLNEPWWWEQVKKAKPQALIVKAQGQGAEVRRYDALFLQWLSTQSGYLVYDTLPDQSALISQEQFIESQIRIPLREPYDPPLMKAFGYAEEASMIHYRPQ